MQMNVGGGGMYFFLVSQAGTPEYIVSSLGLFPTNFWIVPFGCLSGTLTLFQAKGDN